MHANPNGVHALGAQDAFKMTMKCHPDGFVILCNTIVLIKREQ